MVIRNRWVQIVFLLLLLVALGSTVGWTRAPQAATLSVKGTVTNGTPGGEVPTGLEVTLHVLSDGEETQTLTTTLAADGTFVFERVPTGENQTLVVEVVYQGVSYTSEMLTPAPDERELDAPVTVYESTEDPTSVRVVQAHIFVTDMKDRFLVEEYWLIGNEGDRTYVGAEDPETGKRMTVRFTLPEGIADLTFDGPGRGERFVERPDGFADTHPVRPGSTTSEVAFLYTVPHQEGFRVEQAVDVPVESVVILMVQGDMALEGPGLEPMGTVDTQMGPALSYIAGPLAAGEGLAFTLVPAPPPVMESIEPTGHPAAAPPRNVAREAAVGLAALALAVVGASLLWRPTPGPVPIGIRPLVEQIAALDMGYASGRIPEETYHERRDELIRQARSVLESQDSR